MIQKLLLALAPLPLLAACGDGTTVAEDTAPEPVQETLEEQTEAPVLSEEIADLVTAEFEEFGTVSYRAGAVDLNGDGNEEWLVFVTGPGICGSGGCPLRVFEVTADGAQSRGKLSVTQMPVGAFASESEGWRDLAVTIGGGGLEYAVAKVPFSNGAYASNPTVTPAEPSSEDFTTVIALPEM